MTNTKYAFNFRFINNIIVKVPVKCSKLHNYKYMFLL